MDELRGWLAEREVQGLRRTLPAVEARGDGRIRVGGRDYLDVSGNDYLGLCTYPQLVAAAQAATARYGTGAGAARLLGGGCELHRHLEQALARFKHQEMALLFNSGYQANCGIISALLQPGDAVFADRLAHASLLDGVRLCGARLFRFRHNDATQLDELLQRERAKFRRALIVTESVFSMDGDCAPLRDLAALKQQHAAWLLVDEAHATGIFGATGAGKAEEAGVADSVDLLMGTCSKALGSAGGYVAASASFINTLINSARSFIFSTALPPAVVAASLAALDVIRDEPQRRTHLQALAVRLRQGLAAQGITATGDTQIVPVILGSEQRALAIAQRLRVDGIWVLPIRYPTVPHGSARLRLSLSAAHQAADIDRLAERVAAACAAVPA